MKQNLRTHAIVIGGSLAGLLAARVLTDHFKTVTLIERDAFPADIDNRKGVPKAGTFMHYTSKAWRSWPGTFLTWSLRSVRLVL
jgi:2-polyprenyl-6-methoxyphenol hydroxylase-like FAD-dependent oxidoreductase